MSLAHEAVAQLRVAQDYFNRSTRNLREEDSTFAPVEGVMTAAQQVAHSAHTIGWFTHGAFSPDGFDMDFESHAKIVMGYTSITAAKEWFDREIAAAVELLSGKSDAELGALLPEGMIKGGLPRMAILGGITDHTAHHRGALTVYARLRGIVPPMPYMDM
jgi:uncharacterized damage-inducible protein DinB